MNMSVFKAFLSLLVPFSIKMLMISRELIVIIKMYANALFL